MISLLYTSHTKAYNTIYTACNIVEAIYSFTQISQLDSAQSFSVPSDRLFSTARGVITEHGARLLPDVQKG